MGLLNKVNLFHETFECHIEDDPTTEIPKEAIAIRVKLIQEELEEYREAIERGDIISVADPLTDMLYVTLQKK